MLLKEGCVCVCARSHAHPDAGAFLSRGRSADELLLTEMMFNGLFNDLSAEQATALLSCFVFQENVSSAPACHLAAVLLRAVQL